MKPIWDDPNAENAYIIAGTDREAGLYHGLMMLNRPTPSGLDRWTLQFSTKQGFPEKGSALELIQSIFPNCPIGGVCRGEKGN